MRILSLISRARYLKLGHTCMLNFHSLMRSSTYLFLHVVRLMVRLTKKLKKCIICKKFNGLYYLFGDNFRYKFAVFSKSITFTRSKVEIRFITLKKHK